MTAPYPLPKLTPSLDGPPTSPVDLLTDSIVYGGWEGEIGKKKAFYVRGMRWFQSTVLSNRLNVTDVSGYIDEMQERLVARPDWLKLSFDWDEKFSSRQFIDAASPSRRYAPRFDKAVKIIVLCETIADALRKKHGDVVPRGKEVYRHLQILPAVFYIHDFNRSVLDQAQSQDGKFLTDLRTATQQPTSEVFRDMADRKTVSRWLAQCTSDFFAERLPKVDLGSVSSRFRSNVKFTPSTHEFWDFDLEQPSDSSGEALQS